MNKLIGARWLIGIICLISLGLVLCLSLRRENRIISLRITLPSRLAIDRWQINTEVYGVPDGVTDFELSKYTYASDSMQNPSYCEYQRLVSTTKKQDNDIEQRCFFSFARGGVSGLDSAYLIEDSAGRDLLPPAARMFAESALAILDKDSIGYDAENDFAYRLLIGARPYRGVISDTVLRITPVRLLKIESVREAKKLRYIEYWPSDKSIVCVIDKILDDVQFNALRAIIEKFDGGIYFHRWLSAAGPFYGPYFNIYPSHMGDSTFFNYSALSELIEAGRHRLSYGLVGPICSYATSSTCGGLEAILPGVKNIMQPLLSEAVHQRSAMNYFDYKKSTYWNSDDFWWYGSVYQKSNLIESIR